MAIPKEATDYETITLNLHHSDAVVNTIQHILSQQDPIDVPINDADINIAEFGGKHIHKGNETPIRNLLF